YGMQDILWQPTRTESAKRVRFLSEALRPTAEKPDCGDADVTRRREEKSGSLKPRPGLAYCLFECVPLVDGIWTGLRVAERRIDESAKLDMAPMVRPPSQHLEDAQAKLLRLKSQDSIGIGEQVDEVHCRIKDIITYRPPSTRVRGLLPRG